MQIIISPDTRIFRFALPDGHVLGLPTGKHVKVFGPNPQGIHPGEWNGREDPDAGKQEISRPYTPTTSDEDVGHFDLVVKVGGRHSSSTLILSFLLVGIVSLFFSVFWQSLLLLPFSSIFSTDFSLSLLLYNLLLLFCSILLPLFCSMTFSFFSVLEPFPSRLLYNLLLLFCSIAYIFSSAL